jgi:hypothetical protein
MTRVMNLIGFDNFLFNNMIIKIDVRKIQNQLNIMVFI